MKLVGRIPRTRSKIPVKTIANAAMNCNGDINPRRKRVAMMNGAEFAEVSDAKAFGTHETRKLRNVGHATQGEGKFVLKKFHNSFIQVFGQV